MTFPNTDRKEQLLKQDIPRGCQTIEPHIHEHLPSVMGNMVCKQKEDLSFRAVQSKILQTVTELFRIKILNQGYGGIKRFIDGHNHFRRGIGDPYI